MVKSICFTGHRHIAKEKLPAALILQVFYIGPLVRWLFRLLFRRNKKSAARN